MKRYCLGVRRCQLVNVLVESNIKPVVELLGVTVGTEAKDKMFF